MKLVITFLLSLFVLTAQAQEVYVDRNGVTVTVTQEPCKNEKIMNFLTHYGIPEFVAKWTHADIRLPDGKLFQGCVTPDKDGHYILDEIGGGGNLTSKMRALNG